MPPQRRKAPTLARFLAAMAVSEESRQEAAGPNLPPVETVVAVEVAYPPALAPETRTSRPVPVIGPQMPRGKAPTPACDLVG